MSSPLAAFSVPARLIIASRESRLALVQSEWIAQRLRGLYPAMQVEILGMTTRGDQILDRPLAQIGGKGLFIKELEVAMQEGRADIAVHSMKDMPSSLPPGFTMIVVGEREDPFDAFVSNRYASLVELPHGAVVGTSSLRRESQLRLRYPHLTIKSLRGNVETRLRKLDEGEYDAIILAAAGLKRLGLAQRIRATLAPEVSLPAIGQGALALEFPSDRGDIADALQPFALASTSAAVTAERALGTILLGSCDVPLAAHATMQGALLHLRGYIGMPDGSRFVQAELHGAPRDAATLGRTLGQRMIDDGAHDILNRLAALSVTSPQPLQGLGVLLTRPVSQAQRTATLLRGAGAEVFEFPALEIASIETAPALDSALAALPTAHWIIFVSANAVEYGMPHVKRGGVGPNTRLAAIGNATRAALLEQGLTDVITPLSGNDSEALLAHPDLQRVAGQHIIIFRGHSESGGRKLLGEVLTSRGALIHNAECYHRSMPAMDAQSLERVLTQWERGAIGAVHVMSVETLHNLLTLTGERGRAMLSSTTIITPHERIAQVAHALGFAKTVVSGLSDAQLITSLTALKTPR